MCIRDRRNGMMLSAEDLPNPDKRKDNIDHGSVLPTRNKKLISNSLNVLYAKMGQCQMCRRDRSNFSYQ